MTCRICQNGTNNRAFTAREMMFGLRDEFQYFECGRCGCVQIAEIPSSLAKYYAPAYYSFRKDNVLKAILKRSWAAYSYDGTGLFGCGLAWLVGINQAVQSLKKAQLPKQAAILDVGCGSGDLLWLLRTLGFSDLTGADPFIPNDIQYDNGITVWKRELCAISQPFDLIMLHHSFEHMTAPLEVLRQAARLLRPNGILIIRTPVAGSYAWRQYGANWVQLDAPRHIFLPTVHSMQLLAERAGLRVNQVVYDSTELQFWGSEQYRRDIPLHDRRSLARLPRQMLAFRRIRAYRRRADELNRKGEGDSACFYLSRDAGQNASGKR